MMIRNRFYTILLTLSLSAAACSKRNPDACCETAEDCRARGFDQISPCPLGTCVAGACIDTDSCDDDADCHDGAYCVANTCVACRDNTTCAAAAPVCDAQMHACRACTKDAECDSLACDLAAGTCVEPSRVLYASADGEVSAACTRTQPCSIAKAGSLVDAAHPYLALIHGTYLTGLYIANATVTVCGITRPQGPRADIGAFEAVQ